MKQRITYKWVRLSEEKLLDVRFCDLGLSVGNSKIKEYVEEFYAELKAKGLTFQPITYLADEWLTPDGDPVIGIPFFLAHPRLRQLEQKMCLDVEGGTKRSFKQLLRHEAGHAFNYAYLLHKRKRWRKLFGPFSKEYSDTYIYRPYSKSFVRHLDNWYAQCHPDEDFAETFAVWLTPKEDWRKKYNGWKALEKLIYVDELMAEIKDKPPIIKKGQKYFDICRLKTKLGLYYKRKKRSNQENYPDFHDSDLKQIFSASPQASKKKASRLLRSNRGIILTNAAMWSGGKKFIISDLYKDLVNRCDELNLLVCYNEVETVSKVTAYITSLVMNYLVTGSFKKRK